MSNLLAVKRNQLAINKLILLITETITQHTKLIELIGLCNSAKTSRAYAMHRKNKCFNYLCQLQDALTLERNLMSYYQQQQNKIEYADKFAVTHNVISDVIKTNDKKMWEQKNKILLQNAMIADVFKNNSLVNWSH